MPIAQAQSPWNSLEAIKLIVSVLTPIILLLFGFWINRRIKRLESIQWANQKVTERRLRIFDELAPLLNDLLCYYTYIGLWKELTPPDVVSLKRKIDKIAYVNAPLFPAEFLTQFNNFMHKCYSTYAGWGEDAKLLSKFQRRKEAYGSEWKSDWETCFAEDQETNPNSIRQAYCDFMAYFSQALGVGLQSDFVRSGDIPHNIR